MTEKSAEKQLVEALKKFPDNGLALRCLLNEIERRLIRKALVKTDGNESQACKLLGMKRTTFRNRIRILDDKSFVINF